MKTYIFLIALLSAASLATGEIPDVGIANPQDNDSPTATSLGWIRVEAGAFLGWEEVKRAHESGLIRVAVPQPTKAFDRHHKIWVDIPQGTELASISVRCTGWMNGFITAGYAGWDKLYFREWDVVFHDKASGRGISDLLETCQRSSLTRELIVAAQQEGLLQAFTNKAIALMGENGALIYVGPRFRNREQFEVEWQSRSTSGILRIAANRLVTLENEPCRPFSQVKIHYAGGTFLIRAVDLDIRMADQNLSKTPLGPAFSLFCDEKQRN
jgi:hypothetical protein